MGTRSSEGDLLERLIAEARDHVLLVAPFVKAKTLSRCLSQASPELVVEVFTRWRPDEIAASVSDLETYEVLRARANATLHLHHRLHAKMYRSESKCLVGSANLTGRALGWVCPANLEILIECDGNLPEVAAFEQTLRSTAVRVDDSVHAAMLSLMESYDSTRQSLTAAEEIAQWGGGNDCVTPGKSGHSWLPQVRQPADLYIAYAGTSRDLSTQVYAGAVSDLAVLDPPTGLSESSFRAAVAMSLLQMPIVVLIDEAVQTAQRFGAIVDLIQNHFGMERDEAVLGWQALMRWLLYFMPERYERAVHRHTEMFLRRDHAI